jgi:hypothetical protein
MLSLLAIAATFFGATTVSAQPTRCRAMLTGAPENVLQLDAVRSCRGAGASCAYMSSEAG